MLQASLVRVSSVMKAVEAAEAEQIDSAEVSRKHPREDEPRATRLDLARRAWKNIKGLMYAKASGQGAKARSINRARP